MMMRMISVINIASSSAGACSLPTSAFNALLMETC